MVSRFFISRPRIASLYYRKNVYVVFLEIIRATGAVIINFIMCTSIEIETENDS